MQYLRVVILFVAALMALLSGAAYAQGAGTYPSKPVVLILPQAPGGPTDVEVRLYATKMGELMGQQFILDFKPGAGGTIANAYIAKARPDGYSLLVVTSAFTVVPALYKDLPFDVIRDFAPVSLLSQKPLVLVARPSFPAKNLVEYLAYAKLNPEKINYGTTGAGATAHLVGAWLHSRTNTKVTFIAYKGAGPMALDLLSGRVDVTATSLSAALPQIKSGKLRAMAITDDKRLDILPEVLTVAEQGVPGYRYMTWLGILAPGATPAAIVNKLSEGFSKVAKTPEVVATLDGQGSIPVGGTPAQFGQIIVAETANWRKLVQDAGIKLAEE